MPEPPQRPGSLWIRLTLGALLVILASASATAVAAFHEVDRLAGAFGGRLELGGGLAEADAGKPQTVLIIGSDKRARTAQDARLGLEVNSDTMILARLDPSKKATALMSLPRDLKVRIPGHGTDKLNAAYALGGPRLTLETIKQLTGLRINHVINVDFGGFRKAVDAIGCVYVDIDRRYFNARTGPGGYAAIDVPPGYQRLCGEKALQYVRHRHTDNDLVRSARQQDFLRQAKQQLGVGRLIADRAELVEIFGRYTESDIKGNAEVLRLLKLVIASAGHPIREVHFEGRIGGKYVTVGYDQIEELISQFLGVEETQGPRGTVEPRRRRRSRRPPPLR
ncbi:MAG: LCP family protein, partial [Actinomycetota bacterium]|nr:LCP family protein [Actinomycetota bacterium]